MEAAAGAIGERTRKKVNMLSSFLSLGVYLLMFLQVSAMYLIKVSHTILMNQEKQFYLFTDIYRDLDAVSLDHVDL